MSRVSQVVALQMRQRGLSSRPGAARRPPAAGASAGHAVKPAAALATAAAPEATSTARANTLKRVKLSGINGVDSLLAGGTHWFHDAGASGSSPAALAKHSLTYSFLASSAGLSGADASGFRALDATHKQRVRDALAHYASIIDVTFDEVDSGGDIQYGANTQKSSAGYAYYPNSLPGGSTRVMLAANQSTFTGNWANGSYQWEVILHETGHALGLKHPGNYNAGGGGTAGPYLPAASDNRSNTIMSYREPANMKRVIALGDGRFTSQRVNPDSLQGLDVTALQYLYGAARGTDPMTYSFTPDEIFSRTIWNPNAGSAIDLSNQTRNNVVDLRAGRKSSIAIRDPYAETGLAAADYAKRTALKSALGVPTYGGRNNLTIAAGSQFTAATGGSGNDSFIANSKSNTIAGGDGNDRVFWTGGDLSVDGGNGADTLFVKRVAAARWTLSEDRSTLSLVGSDADGGGPKTLRTITLAGIEAVKLWDGVSIAKTGKTLYAIA